MLWLRARRAMFDPNPNEISNQTLIPNDAWNDGSCVSDHERLESGAVQNWLGARVRAVLYIATHRGRPPAAPKGGEAGARSRPGNVSECPIECAADPPGTRPGGDKIHVMSTLSHYRTDRFALDYFLRRKGRCGRLTQPMTRNSRRTRAVSGGRRKTRNPDSTTTCLISALITGTD